MRIIIIVAIIILKGTSVNAMDYYNISPELSNMQEILDKSISDEILDISPKNLIKDLLSGTFKFDFKKFVVSLIKLLLKDISSNAKILANLMLLAILCDILNNIQNSFGKSEHNSSSLIDNFFFNICSYFSFLQVPFKLCQGKEPFAK